MLEAVVTGSDAVREALVRVVGSVEINRPADQVWAYVADYGNDTSSGEPVSARCTRRGPDRPRSASPPMSGCGSWA